MRIFIAEDDPITLRLLARMVQSWGHEVVLAVDGTDAWELLQQPDVPSLLILDRRMPGLDGVELCIRLRGLEREVSPYIIMLTAVNDKQAMLEGFDAGADDYVTKPFDPDELRVRLRAGERIIRLQIESLVSRDALRKLASHDFLTGLRNRATILAALQQQCDAALRNGADVSVVMIDLDGFKGVNDVYGHQVGDKVLADAARRMASEVRSYESIGRYGGEEFLIVLSDCPLAETAKLAERVRAAIAGRPFEANAGRSISLSMSLGVASSAQIGRPDKDLLIQLADRALYAAKQLGRNRVELAENPTGEVSVRPACLGATP